MSLESLDWDALVSPISKKSPAGEDIKNDPVFDEIKTSRKPRELEELDSSDWLKVEKLCVEALSKQCKHLQVATWLLEAVGHLYGYAGAAKGFEFLAEMIDKFWEDFFPKIDTDDEDDPLGYRIPIMEWLEDRFCGAVLKAIPLTREEPGYSLVHYYVTLESGDRRKALLEAGYPNDEQFRGALDALPADFLEARITEVRACQEALSSLEKVTDKRFVEEKIPILGFARVKDALDDAERLVGAALEKKQRPKEAPPEPVSEPPQEVLEQHEATAPEPQKATSATVAQTTPRPSATPPSGVDGAMSQIFELAQYLQKDNAYRPVAYLLSRAVAWGDLIGKERVPEGSSLPAPSAALRQALEELFTNGDWFKLLQECERSLSDPSARSWLDLHYYSLYALQELVANDRYYERASLAIRGQLRSLLEIHPDLLKAELEDGTPIASEGARKWFSQQGLIGDGSIAILRTTPCPRPSEMR
jgi:type VI secretion system ImpA family protein